MQDGVLTLEILYRNGSPVIVTKVVKQLLENYEQDLKLQALKKTKPQLSSTDV